MANYQSTHTGQEHDAYCTKSQLINLVYPVGSIYMSINSTSPQTLFGGTWQQISDTFLLCAGNTYTAGSTGGEATHTLNVNEMPSHSHNIYFDLNSTVDWFIGLQNLGSSGANPDRSAIASGPTGRSYTMGIRNTGGGTAHNNMPPYLAVYVWKRTA